MFYRYNITLLLVVAVAGLSGIRISAQQPVKSTSRAAFFDSIDHRISYLENQVAHLKKKRDVAYLNVQRELSHTQFLKKYQEYVADEDLDKAKELVQSGKEKAEFRKDQSSVKFYLGYEDHVYALIKQQRIHYQQLFKKEKILKKEFNALTAQGSMAAYQKAQRMILLALKYARENNLAETVSMLETYEAYTQALMFDLKSEYDLAQLTINAKNFEKVFMPLVTSDSLEGIREADRLLSQCIHYGRFTGSPLTGEYFRIKGMMVTSAISDVLDRQGREKELVRYTDKSVMASSDTLNPCGVFKWHDKIIVIDEFTPDAWMENVKKGEAIIHADRMLATYLQKNRLSQSVKNLRAGGTFIIPYKSGEKNSSFLYNEDSGKWQFIACYTMVESPSFTAEISRLMPPLYFEDEISISQKIEPVNF